MYLLKGLPTCDTRPVNKCTRTLARHLVARPPAGLLSKARVAGRQIKSLAVDRRAPECSLERVLWVPKVLQRGRFGRVIWWAR